MYLLCWNTALSCIDPQLAAILEQIRGKIEGEVPSDDSAYRLQEQLQAALQRNQELEQSKNEIIQKLQTQNQQLIFQNQQTQQDLFQPREQQNQHLMEKQRVDQQKRSQTPVPAATVQKKTPEKKRKPFKALAQIRPSTPNYGLTSQKSARSTKNIVNYPAVITPVSGAAPMTERGFN